MAKDAGGGGNRRSIATRGKGVGVPKARKPDPPPKKPAFKLFSDEQLRANEATKKAIRGIAQNVKTAKKVLTGQ